MGKIWTKEFADRYSDLSRFDRTKFNTVAKGTSFREEEVLQVRDEDLVVIIPEVGNQYDEFACMIMHDNTGNQIGYLPKEINKQIWKNIREHGHLYIGKVRLSGENNLQVNINMIHMSPKDATV